MDLEKLQNKGFIVKYKIIGGDECVLISPAYMGSDKWTHDNLIYRSSMWRKKDMFPVSLGYKKFFNWGERSNVVSEPSSLKGVQIPEKIDGSCLLVSYYNGEIIIRTRGTFDARELNSGYEIKYLTDKYPKAFENEMLESEKYTFIYEWVSPSNKIILDYGTDPDIYLTGMVEHSSYRYQKQDFLDSQAELMEVKRPKIYKFNSVVEMLETVKAFEGVEGVCVYFNAGQDIKKIKGAEYLALHAFKSQVSLKNMVDLFIRWGCPKYNAYLARIESEFDFECMRIATPIVSTVCDAYKEVEKIINGMRQFVLPLTGISRKEASEKIFNSYGKTNRAGYVFKLLDGKEINDDGIKKLLFQILIKE